MTILYGVTFPEPIMSLPRQLQKGIPGAQGWDRWAGWSVSVDASRVLISQEPVDLNDSNVQGVSQAAMDEHEANVGDKTLRLVYSLPISECILLYIEGEPKDKASSKRTPTPALLALLAERAKVAAAPPVRPPGVPTTGYQGPPVTPMRAARPVPPGPLRPPEPPPSTIIMDEDEPGAATP